MDQIAAVLAVIASQEGPDGLEGIFLKAATASGDVPHVLGQGRAACQADDGKAGQGNPSGEIYPDGGADYQRSDQEGGPAPLPQPAQSAGRLPQERADAHHEHQRGELRAGHPVEPVWAGLETLVGESLCDRGQHAADKD